MIELNSVSKIRKTVDPTALLIECNITDDEGTANIVHTWRANDPYGVLTPMLTEWMEAHSEFHIDEYLPPTAEQLRETMGPLSARQVRLGLINAGISLANVEAAINSMPAGQDREKAKVEWEFATTFNRLHPLIGLVGGALGLTEEQIDTMWVAALNM